MKQGNGRQTSEFERQLSGKRTGMIADFLHFLGTNKKWWMLPILIVLLFCALLILLGGTGAAPFIYTLF